MKKSRGRYYFLFLIIIILLLSLVITVSYALFFKTMEGKTVNQITTGSLVLELKEHNSINLVSAVPMYDDKGKKLEPFSFKIINYENKNISYRVSIADDDVDYQKDGCTNNKIPWNKIKYQLVKNGNILGVGYLSDNSGIIDDDFIASKSSNEYSLNLWIDSNASNEIMGKHFHGKIKVDAIVE